MGEPLEDAYAKLDRAGEHLQALKAEIRRFGDSRPYKVSDDVDINNGEYLLRIKPEEPPKRISLLIGDVVSNLRPTLDYLIHALSILDSGKARQSNQFPICDTPSAFKGEISKGRLHGLSPSHKTLIEKLQPYKRRKSKLWLSALRELSNPDKHRHLNVVLSHIEGDFSVRPALQTPNPPSLARSTLLGQLRETSLPPLTSTSGLMLGSITQSPLLTSLATGAPISQTQQASEDDDVHVALHVTVGIALPDGAPVIETMEILESQVAKLLKTFEREF